MKTDQKEYMSKDRGWALSLGSIAVTLEVCALSVQAEIPELWPANVTMAALGGVAACASIIKYRKDK